MSNNSRTIISWNEWVSSPAGTPLPEWEPTPEQLGWPKNARPKGHEVNYAYDADRKKLNERTTPEAQKQLALRIGRGKDGNALVPRSHFPYELNATLNKPAQDGDEAIDQNENVLVYPEVTTINSHDTNTPKLNPHLSAFSTLDNSAAQDLAVLSWEEEEVARILVGVSRHRRSEQSKIHRLGSLIPNPTCPPTPAITPLTGQQLENLRLPDESEILGNFHGNRGLVSHLSNWGTFRGYAVEKTGEINSMECGAELFTKILDVIQAKEQQLYEEERIDKNGKPLKRDGELYATDTAQERAMHKWFHEALLSIASCEGYTYVKEGVDGRQERIFELANKEGALQEDERMSTNAGVQIKDVLENDLVYVFSRPRSAALHVANGAGNGASSTSDSDDDDLEQDESVYIHFRKRCRQ